MAKQKIDPKIRTLTGQSYSSLLGMAPSDAPTKKLKWPVDAHRHHVERSSLSMPPLQKGEARAGVHAGVSYVIRRKK
jgi:hypothetical protein